MHALSDILSHNLHLSLVLCTIYSISRAILYISLLIQLSHASIVCLSIHMLQGINWPLWLGSAVVAVLSAIFMSWFSVPEKKEGEFGPKSTAKEVCDYYAKNDAKFLEGKTFIVTGWTENLFVEETIFF